MDIDYGVILVIIVVLLIIGLNLSDTLEPFVNPATVALQQLQA